MQNLGNIALTYARGETMIDDISHIIIQYAVIQTCRYTVVLAKVCLPDFFVQVGGIILLPCPIASHIRSGIKVDMTVLKFAEHIAKHLLQLRRSHFLVQLATIPCMHLVPIKSYGLCLIVKEAIVLVDYLPQGFHIALWGILELHLIHT